MSESKLTPGPWVANRMPCQSDDHVYNSEVANTEGEIVGSLLRKADARLIAAAPELLAACEALVAAMNEYEWSVDDSPTPQHKAIMQAARRAIEKAKGEV
jgi:hypothetical protein